jgi:hypothetical protein
MSRERLPRAEDDLWSRHPERIVKALQTGELDYHEYAVLSFLVDLIAIPGRNGEAIFTLGRLDEALGWPLGNEWLRQKLQDLRRKGWIDYAEPRRGPGAAWVFRLSGGAIDAKRDESPGEFPTSFQLERPSELETNSNSPRVSQAANPQPDSVSEAHEFPTAQSLRAEQSKAEALSEGNYDQDVGKTTAGASEPTSVERRPTVPTFGDGFIDFIDAAYRNGHITAVEALKRKSIHRRLEELLA